MAHVEIRALTDSADLLKPCEFHVKNKMMWRLNLRNVDSNDFESHYACSNNVCITNWVKELLGGTE